MALTTGITTSANILTTLTPLITAAGWTNPSAGRFLSPTVNSRAIDFTVSAVVAAGVTITTETVLSSSKVFYLQSGSTSTSATIRYTISIGTSYIFIALDAPVAAGLGDPGTRFRNCFGVFPITPYYPNLDTDLSSLLFAFGSSTNVSSSVTQDGAIRKGGYYPTPGIQVGWAPARLMTMRPAVQDIAATGDNMYDMNASATKTFWPFVVVDNVFGIRGTLDKIYMASENYKQTGDLSTYENVRASISGTNYRAVVASRGSTSANGYTPLGLGGTTGGPLVLIPE